MKVLKSIALAILIIGGLNWGLVGLFSFDLVAFLFDGLSHMVTRVIYALVGVASIVSIVCWLIPDHDEEVYYRKSFE